MAKTITKLPWRRLLVFSAAGIVELRAATLRVDPSENGADIYFHLLDPAGVIIGFFALSKISGWVWSDAMPPRQVPTT